MPEPEPRSDSNQDTSFTSLIPVERARGGTLAAGTEVPEALMRQLHDPSVLDETPLYLLTATASNGNVDYYGTRMRPSSLKNYAADAQAGLPFCYSHSYRVLPLGRVYDGNYKQARTPNVARTEMDIYIPQDVNVSGVNTTDLIRALRTGVARDVSITFEPGFIECSLDGRKMARDFWEWLDSDPEDPKSCCRHIPGVEYEVDGETVMAIGEVEKAHTIELSSVYRGATPDAAIMSRSAAMVIDHDRVDARTVSGLNSYSLTAATWLAENDRLSRDEARSLEHRFRGVTFPSITNRIWSPSAEPRRVQPEPTPEAEPMPEPVDPIETRSADTEVDPPSAGAPAVETQSDPINPSVETTAGGAPSEERSIEVVEDAPPASESPVVRDAHIAQTRTMLVTAGLAPEDFDGDPATRLQEVSQELTRERRWGEWGRRWRTELLADIRAEGVRAFGQDGWSEAAYAATLRSGTADELIDLRKHLRDRAAERLRSGRATTEETSGDPPATNGFVVPDHAYRA